MREVSEPIRSVDACQAYPVPTTFDIQGHGVLTNNADDNADQLRDLHRQCKQDGQKSRNHVISSETADPRSRPA